MAKKKQLSQIPSNKARRERTLLQAVMRKTDLVSQRKTSKKSRSSFKNKRLRLKS